MSSSKELPAGSLTAGEPAFLAVGKIRRPHGVNGEMLVEVYTDFPERLRPKTKLYAGETHRLLTIRTCRKQNNNLLLTFNGINSPEEGHRYQNQILYVKTADRPVLPEGEFYHYELLGLEVVNEAGWPLGILTEIISTGANDVYVVTQNGQELLLPAIRDVVLNINLDANTMRVHILPGLMESENIDSKPIT
jgi:16S rRNA processing protein RimM